MKIVSAAFIDQDTLTGSVLEKYADHLRFSDPKKMWPVNYLKDIADIKSGIFTLKEKWVNWAKCLQTEIVFLPEITTQKHFLYLDHAVLCNALLIQAVLALKPHQGLLYNERFVAAHISMEGSEAAIEWISIHDSVQFITYPEDLFLQIDVSVRQDFECILKSGCVSAKLDSSNTLLGDQLFLEEGASVQGAFLNTRTGPIYISKGVTIMEGAMLRGPVFLSENAVVKMGATVYPNVVVGDHTVIGGELGNSNIGNYSAKGHHGYLGCAVIGDWCNFGAGSSNSNLKNNLKSVTLYQIADQSFRQTHLQKCGLIMGDYSRCGIQSAFNTGTVVGMAAMLADTKFYPKFVPSFTWLTEAAMTEYHVEKFIETCVLAYKSKNMVFDSALAEKMTSLFIKLKNIEKDA